MRWTQKQYDEWIAKSASSGSGSGICASEQECAKGKPLECAASGEKESSACPPRRVKITYRIYSTRPLDYDNYWTKCLTDLLVEVGILDGDAWNQLQGETISEKVHQKAQERTEIEIDYEN